MYKQLEQTKFKSRHPLVKLTIEVYKQDLLKLIGRVNPSTILDIGCGEGIISNFVRKHTSARTYGTDYSWEMLSSVSGIIPLVSANVKSLPFREKSLDLCLCLEVLEHIENPTLALTEVMRVGKRSIISVPNDFLMRLGNLSRGKYIRTLGNFPAHINHFNYFSFRRFLEKNFFVEEYKVSGLVWLMALVRPLTSS